MSCLDALQVVRLKPWRPGSNRALPPPPLAPQGVSKIKSPFARTLSPEVRSQYERYLGDNYRGHQAMRGENGLIMDTVHVRQDGKGGFRIESHKTVAAPTDIGLDLLVQVGMSDHAVYGHTARATLERVLSTLEQLPYHKQTGLFHRLYETKRGVARPVAEFDLSSVDNVHLAVGLWTVAQTFPNTPVGARAKKLFERMDFSAFLDYKTRLVGGNLKYTTQDASSAWQLEPYRYHFGSEARSVYTLGYALGLFHSHPDGKPIVDGLKTIPIELGKNGARDHLRVWNGGVFQELLPRSLANEELYSGLMKESAGNIASYMLLDGPYVSRRDGTGFILPAGNTAGVTGIKNSPDGSLEIVYSGKLGARHLKESANPNTMDDSVVALHGILLGAAVSPNAYAPRLAQFETLRHGDLQTYLPNFGWVDSATVVTPGGAPGQLTVRPNSAGVGVDKGIEVLSLLQILDRQGLSVSGRALAEDPTTAARLGKAFQIIDNRWHVSREQPAN